MKGGSSFSNEKIRIIVCLFYLSVTQDNLEGFFIEVTRLPFLFNTLYASKKWLYGLHKTSTVP
ncbi:MAG: hypothetical protein LBP34_00160 [Flavobacteriaceae bacterium]|nr:hypothetical protein [Flavobacteriaceae bacterium]